jgi:hypothetical protein
MRRLQSTDEASNNVGRRADDGERGGKGRRKGKDQRMPRTQCRNWHVPDGLSPRTGTGAQAPNAGRVRPSTGARCGHRRCSEAKSRTPGSARGAGGNSRSYRDQRCWMHPDPGVREARHGEPAPKHPSGREEPGDQQRAGHRRVGDHRVVERDLDRRQHRERIRRRPPDLRRPEGGGRPGRGRHGLPRGREAGRAVRPPRLRHDRPSGA